MCAGADVGVDGTRSAGRVEGPGTPLGRHSGRPGNACSVPASRYLVLEKKEKEMLVVTRFLSEQDILAIGISSVHTTCNAAQES